VLVAPAHLDPERRRRAWLDADPQAPGRVGAFAVEAVALGGTVSLVDDAGDDMVRIEVRDDDASLPAAAGSSPSSCARPRPPSDRAGAAPYASSRAATSRAVPASVTRVLTSRARAAPTIALALSAPTEIPTTCGMRRIRSGVMPSSRGSSG
jgi:hypothetical protein